MFVDTMYSVGLTDATSFKLGLEIPEPTDRRDASLKNCIWREEKPFLLEWEGTITGGEP